MLGLIGRGSTGEVYLARHPASKLTVTVVLLNAPPAGRGQTLEEKLSAAQAACALRHPNIAPPLEVGEVEGHPFIVMQDVAGGGLEALLGSKPDGIRFETTVGFLRQAAAALDHAHERGVAHLGLAPKNLKIDSSGRLLVIEFGVALLSTIDQGVLRTADDQEARMVSPEYMAPEQLLHERVDRRADLFSLAVIAFECFTGARPFPGTTLSVAIASILNGRPLAASALNSAVPRSVDQEFFRALSLDPAARFSSAVEMIESLSSSFKEREAFQEAGSVVEHRTAKPSPSTLTSTNDSARCAEGGSTSASTYTPGGAQTYQAAKPSDRQRSENLPIPRSTVARARNIDPARANYLKQQHRNLLAADAGGLERRGWINTRFDEVRQLLAKSLIVLAALLVVLSVYLFAFDRHRVAPPDAHTSAARGREVVYITDAKPLHLLDDRELVRLLSVEGQGDERILAMLEEIRSRKFTNWIDSFAFGCRHASSEVRLFSVKTLADLEDPRIVEPLVLRLEDPQPSIRRIAAEALGRSGDQRALKGLSSAANIERVPEVHSALLDAIAEIKGFSTGEHRP